MMNTNLKPVLDLVRNSMYNAPIEPNKEKKMRKKVPLEHKKTVVSDISKKHEEDAVDIPAACKQHGIEVYTYYNWKKRVEQLAARKRKSNPVIVRKMLPQNAGATLTVVPPPPKPPITNRSVVIKASIKDLNRVLKELPFDSQCQIELS